MFGLDDIIGDTLDAVTTCAEATAGAIESVAEATDKTITAGIDAIDDFINS